MDHKIQERVVDHKGELEEGKSTDLWKKLLNEHWIPNKKP
jgi:hypothetical protein